jgi:hypothetical protein
MPKRWITCEVVGDGTRANFYRPEVWGEPGVGVAGYWPKNLSTGAPLTVRCVALVWGDAPDLEAAALAHPNVKVIPADFLSDTLGDLTPQQRTFLRNLAEEVGFDYQAAGYTLQTTLRRVVRDLGQRLEPAFGDADVAPSHLDGV